MNPIKLYYSGGVSRVSAEEYIIKHNLPRLISYAYVADIPKFLKIANGEPVKLMLDSGAFTAWSKGDEINRSQFCDYAKSLQDNASIDLVVINLDKIPAEKGRDPTPAELIEAVQVSEENHHWLADQLGLDVVLPVYHQGEGLEVLERMLATKAPYICISPRNDLHESLRVEWCNQTFRHIPSEIKVHGLATTGNMMMRRSPWYSVDSATYIMVGAYGGIFYKNRILTVSDDSKAVKDLGQHVTTMAPNEIKAISDFCESKGYNLKTLGESHESRILWNVQHLHENIITPDLTVTQETLF